MENINPPDLLRYLEKESEVFTQSHRSVFDELTKLQVEEETLMRTFYDILSAQGLMKKRENIDENSEMYQNQVPGESAARQTQQDENEVSNALITASEKYGNGVLNGGQIEADHSLAPLLLLPSTTEDENWSSAARQTQQDETEMSRALIIASEKAGNGVLNGGQVEADHNQTPLLLLPSTTEDENWSSENHISNN